MNTRKQINIALIDDHKLFREGIKRILEYAGEFRIVAEGDDGSMALDIVKDHNPDIVLMDINMSNVNGLEATTQLINKYPDMKIIILSIHDDQNYVTHVLKTGARGYLLKEMDADSLIEAIKVVYDGKFYLHPKVTHKLMVEYRRLATEVSSNVKEDMVEYRKPLHLLTKRECEVLQLMAEGKSNRAIAVSLYISEKTVKNHVSNILQKMTANDRTQAVVAAIKNGWVKVL